MRPHITPHAQQRFAERFPGNNPFESFKRSVEVLTTAYKRHLQDPETGAIWVLRPRRKAGRSMGRRLVVVTVLK